MRRMHTAENFRALWKSTPEALPWLNSVYRELEPPDPDFTREDIAAIAVEELADAKSFPSKKRPGSVTLMFWMKTATVRI